MSLENGGCYVSYVPVSQFLSMDSKNNTICGSRKNEKNTRHRPRISRCTVFVFNHQFGMRRLCPRGNGDAILVIPGYAEMVLIILLLYPLELVSSGWRCCERHKGRRSCYYWLMDHQEQTRRRRRRQSHNFKKKRESNIVAINSLVKILTYLQWRRNEGKERILVINSEDQGRNYQGQIAND